jgi:hypothetical protein
MKEILCRCATAVADADTYLSLSHLQFSLIQTDKRLNVVVLFFAVVLFVSNTPSFVSRPLFLFIFIFYSITYIHIFIQSQYIHPSPFAEASLHFLIACMLSGDNLPVACGAEPRIELRPALQQADALPTEPRRTITEPRRTILSHAAPY